MTCHALHGMCFAFECHPQQQCQSVKTEVSYSLLKPPCQVSEVGRGVQSIAAMVNITRVHNTAAAVSFMRRITALAQVRFEIGMAIALYLAGAANQQLSRPHRGDVPV